MPSDHHLNLSERPTLRYVPAPKPSDVELLQSRPPSPSEPPSRARRGWWLVLAISLACGGLLLGAATFQFLRVRRAEATTAVAGAATGAAAGADTAAAPAHIAVDPVIVPTPVEDVARPVPATERPSHAATPAAAAAPAAMPAAASLVQSAEPMERAPSAIPERARAVPALTGLTDRPRPRAPRRVRERRERERGVEDVTAARDELDAGAVSAVIGRNRGRLRQCYTTAIRRSGQIREMHVRLGIDIDTEGSVSGVAVEGAHLEGMERCLRRTAMAWGFPASSHGGHVPLSVQFSPEQPR